jgi:hypothetical protein
MHWEMKTKEAHLLRSAVPGRHEWDSVYLIYSRAFCSIRQKASVCGVGLVLNGIKYAPIRCVFQNRA